MNTPQPGKYSKVMLYTVAVVGMLLQLAAIVLMVGGDVSVALVAPLMIVGMFMTFGPALAAKRAAPK